MELSVRQVSSLEKIRANDSLPCNEIHDKTAMLGERFSYQICMKSDQRLKVSLAVESKLSEYVKLYLVKDVYMDMPTYEKDLVEEDYITLDPGLMPDVLIPLEEQHNVLTLSEQVTSVWVKVDIPKDLEAGNYDLKIKIAQRFNQFSSIESSDTMFEFYEIMRLTVIPAVIPKQRLIYTRWLYIDCIAEQHNVRFFSEEHWDLIDKYIAAAVDVGINMILVPIHTPPLDTAIGARRACVQLVDIEKKREKYEFSFGKFRRFIDICKKRGIQYYEMAHMFTQWGAKYAANIMVTENGKTDYLFGWHVAANSREYVSFLKQYIAAISAELESEGISEKTYFHISDEPLQDNLETYKTATEIIRPLIGKSKTFDALSNYDIYEKGQVECPVTSVDHVSEFLKHEIENQWVYYACVPERVYTNCFMAMPSCRVRILGFLLYKYNIKGFLHWGFNFYNTELSHFPINPYLTTSGDKAHPSGDSFIVYPGKGCAYPSIRGEVTYEAIFDMDICFALEEWIGRKAVVEMIDRAAGRELTFDNYPKNKDFLEKLRSDMIIKISEYC